MFGRRKLSKVGVRASADVIQAEQSAASFTIGDPNLFGNTHVRWNLQLRVLPFDDSPFDATVDATMPQSTAPRPGTRVAVVYDPKDHSRVELDQQPVADQPVDAGRPDLLGEVMGMPMGGLIGRAIFNPNGFRSEMMHLSEQIQQQAMAAGQVQPFAQAPQATEGPDPVDRLERLAALKDRGLLTDEEFQQQKRRILGQ